MTVAADTVALSISFERLWVDGLIDNDEKIALSRAFALSKKHTQFKTWYKNLTLFKTKMTKIDTQKPNPLGPHIPI